MSVFRLIKVFMILCFCTQNLLAQTITEKKAGMIGGRDTELSPELRRFLIEVNKELKEKQEQLAVLQKQITNLYEAKAPLESYRDMLLQINEIKENIHILQQSWREIVSQPEMYDEGYALWHQPETTIEQLVSDYGSSDYVYLIAPEIASLKLSIGSNIPIPHAAWGEMLEQILMQNGVGIKELNPYLRSLYPINKDLSNLRLITNNPQDLEAYPNNAKVSFVLTPEPMEVRRVWYFLEKFANPHTTVLQRIGRAILIVGEISAIKELLKIYSFVTANKRELEYKAVPLFRVDAEEMAKILSAIFTEFAEASEIEVETIQPESPLERGKKPPMPRPTSSGKIKSGDVNALNVIALPKIAQAVFLIGTREEIKKAEDIIAEVENQVAGARQKEVFMYHVKHSDPEELADVLERIYIMMMQNRIQYVDPEIEKLKAENFLAREREDVLREDERRDRYFLEREYLEPTPIRVYQQSYYQQGGYLVNPRPIEPAFPERKEFNKNRDNFIIDPKTGLLVMVVEVDLIQKLKDVIKKLDVPKRMVQIEVLLFEKRIRNTNSYGLNLLRIGTLASQTHATSLLWNNIGTIKHPMPENAGIFQFLISRKKTDSGIPAFDLSYKFLMSQDDVYISANPSVVTLNQTPAVIAVNEEISVKTGVYQVETSAGTTLQDAFTRAQYGITITVTPTIHMAEEDKLADNETDYVTLQSDITFDTFTTSTDQPDVNRRHITNEVRIPDGQTVIIGGLRRKNSRDTKEYIPFLGEIPCVGKLFSITTLQDDETEMIIFLTPKIISEPREDFARLRMQEMCRRPGDLPMFLYRLNEALEWEKKCLFKGYMTFLFGRPGPRYVCEEGEYDGR
jgi:general secretion pathway protein D